MNTSLRTNLITCSAVFALAGGLLLNSPVRARGAAPAKLLEAVNVRYSGTDSNQVLDIFSPAPNGSAPVVVFAHGGSWVAGDKNYHGKNRDIGRFLAEHGLVAVLINYRLAPWVKHPDNARDVAAAYAWVRRNITAYGGDRDRIILSGHSAGAQLVSLVVTDETYLKDPALKLTDRDRQAVRGVVAVSGIYRIPSPNEFDYLGSRIVRLWLENAGLGGEKVGTISSAVAGAGKRLNPFRLAFGEDPEVLKQASPLTHVRRGLPPFLLVSAEFEVETLPEMAQSFAEALRKAGCSVQQHEAPGQVHRDVLFHLRDKDNTLGKVICDFVTKHSRAPL
jgi:acetyl esterase/lipase